MDSNAAGDAERKSTRLSPDEWHARNHVFPGPLAECRDCARNFRRCAGKITYADVQTALAKAHEINVERGWTPALRPYVCRYCGGYHLSTARKKRDTKAAEKNRRKWLRRQIEATG